MTRLIAICICLLMSLSCALSVRAADVDTLPENNGGSEIMLVVALVIVIFGGIYLFFKLKKER